MRTVAYITEDRQLSQVGDRHQAARPVMDQQASSRQECKRCRIHQTFGCSPVIARRALICRGAESGANASFSALLGEDFAGIGGNGGRGVAPPSGGSGDQVGHCPNEALIRRGAESGSNASSSALLGEEVSYTTAPIVIDLTEDNSNDDQRERSSLRCESRTTAPGPEEVVPTATGTSDTTAAVNVPDHVRPQGAKIICPICDVSPNIISLPCCKYYMCIICINTNLEHQRRTAIKCSKPFKPSCPQCRKDVSLWRDWYRFVTCNPKSDNFPRPRRYAFLRTVDECINEGEKIRKSGGNSNTKKIKRKQLRIRLEQLLVRPNNHSP